MRGVSFKRRLGATALGETPQTLFEGVREPPEFEGCLEPYMLVDGGTLDPPAKWAIRELEGPDVGRGVELEMGAATQEAEDLIRDAGANCIAWKRVESDLVAAYDDKGIRTGFVPWAGHRGVKPGVGLEELTPGITIYVVANQTNWIGVYGAGVELALFTGSQVPWPKVGGATCRHFGGGPLTGDNQQEHEGE